MVNKYNEKGLWQNQFQNGGRGSLRGPLESCSAEPYMKVVITKKHFSSKKC